MCIVLDQYARRTKFFAFLLMSAIYGYVGVTYLFFHYVSPRHWNDNLYYWYFILTGIALVAYLMSQIPKRSNA